MQKEQCADIYYRLKALCMAKGTNITNAAKESGVPAGAPTSWKKVDTPHG